MALIQKIILATPLSEAGFSGKPAYHLHTVKTKKRGSRKGKVRRTEVPNGPMRQIQEGLLRALRELNVPQPYAAAYKFGDRPHKNVERHRLNRYFLLLDLKDAYYQVDIPRLAQVLCEVDLELAGQEKVVQAFLQRFCQSRFGGLPQGAPASPHLFNLYCAKLLDEPLSKICRGAGLTYSRYGDDLVFSGEHTVSRRTRQKIAAAIKQAGFEANSQKFHLHDLADRHVVINGICLELGGRMFASREYRRHLEELLHEGLQGNLVLKNEIFGAVGYFWGIVDRHKMTKSEKKIIKLYYQFRTLWRKNKNKRRG